MISVIITSYKRESSIVLRAVNSVLAQTYDDLEIIIVDDNPNGNEFSTELKKTFENTQKLRYIKQDGNKGACAARNLGIKESKGEFIAFLDDDDTWCEDKLQKQLDAFKADTGLVYCLGNTVDTTESQPVMGTYYTEKYFLPQVSFKDLLFQDCIGSTSQPLIRRECFEKCGGFDETLKARQDYEMWLRISRDYPIIGVPEKLFNHYMHKGEQIAKNPHNALQGYESVYRKYKKDFNAYPKAKKEILSKLLKPAKRCGFFVWLKYLIPYTAVRIKVKFGA